MRYLVLIISLFLPLGAQANDLPPECKILPVHVSEKMSADYVPGVDVKGRPVTPADVNAQPFHDLDRVVIPLSVDLAERLDTDIEGLELDADLGTLEIYQSGRVVYNGQDWTSQVYTICGEQVPADTPVDIPTDIPEKADGQDAPDPVQSEAIEVAPLEAIPPSN